MGEGGQVRSLQWGAPAARGVEPSAAREEHWPSTRERGPLLQAHRVLKVICEL